MCAAYLISFVTQSRWLGTLNMAADGTAPRRLTRHPERDDYPAWHPDGRRLVIVSERDGRHDLYLIQVSD